MQEITWRVTSFVIVLLIMIFWEFISPRRKANFSRLKRWPGNLGLVVLNSILLRLFFPVLAVGAALVNTQYNFGILHQFALPFVVKVFLAVIMLDLVVYFQHRVFHKIPILWRMHKMHHTDLDFDTTTGLRFHPIEIVLSMVIKIVAVFVLGAPAIAVLIFEILLNATSLFNHGNVYLSPKIDKYLRKIIVTPDMHRVHHSIEWKETNSNFGFNLSIWDRIYKTYISQPKAGHDDMIIGINQFRNPKYLALNKLLLLPFLKIDKSVE